MNLNFSFVLRVIGLLVILNGLFMLTALPWSFHYDDGAWQSILIAGGSSILAGIILRFLTRKNKNTDIRKREGYLVVASGWIFMSLTGMLPYLIDGMIPGVANAFFETMSGYTTTGASILNDIESNPESLLFWRSLTQWIGGMGIIVLTIAILPVLGIGGMQLFVAESPGPSPDKLHPRITETAKRLWLVYLLLTLIEFALLKLGGMSWFDAVNHAMTTMSTGGFSPKNASIAHYDSPFIQYVIIVFMFLAGVNFTLNYFALRGKFSKMFRNEEFRFYLFSVVAITVFCAVIIYSLGWTNIEQSTRDALFQVTSILTTTGFVSADYTAWAPILTIVFLLLMFIGASAGSTSGSVKIVRHLILLKNSWLELKRLIHPSAIIPVRFNKKPVSQEITLNILAFFLIYILVFVIGSGVMTLLGLDPVSALGSVTATLGNIGPGIGSVGPVENFAHISIAGKWFLSFLMLLGRLELFTILVILSPFFWRKN